MNFYYKPSNTPDGGYNCDEFYTSDINTIKNFCKRYHWDIRMLEIGNERSLITLSKDSTTIGILKGKDEYFFVEIVIRVYRDSDRRSIYICDQLQGLTSLLYDCCNIQNIKSIFTGKVWFPQYEIVMPLSRLNNKEYTVITDRKCEYKIELNV